MDDGSLHPSVPRYLDACGGGYRLQIARTASMDNKSLEHSVMGSSHLLLEEDSYTAHVRCFPPCLASCFRPWPPLS